MIQLYNVDCREAMAGMAENSVDSVVTDPPYGIRFMGREWDHGVPGVEFWTAAMRVMKPGAYMLAFGGTRTFHRLVCAIEDAGFEIRDTIMWVYGSGFPKSLDVAKAIDKESGVEFDAVPASGVGFMNAEGAGGYNITKNQLVRRGESTDAAKQWQGWGTALKPSFEPVILVRKPLIGTVAANVLAHGTGGLNIDGCRVATDDFAGMTSETFSGVKKGSGSWNADDKGMFDAGRRGGWLNGPPVGRWPANLIHDGSDEVLEAFPQAPGQLADAKTSGERKFGNVYSPMRYGRGDEASANSDNEGQVGFKMKPGARRLDEGSAARFFYCSKASRKDRNSGLDGVQSITIEWSTTAAESSWGSEDQKVTLLVGTEQSHQKVIGVFGASKNSAQEWNTLLFGKTVTDLFLPDSMSTTKTTTNSTTNSAIWSCFQNLITSEDTRVVSGGAESGGSPAQTAENGILRLHTTSVKMASALGVDGAVSQMQLRISAKEWASSHPTVKPTDLMRYLCRLVTPPGGVVLDPFMGSGSTGKAAMLEGFDFIGCDNDPESFATAERRIGAAELERLFS